MIECSIKNNGIQDKCSGCGVCVAVCPKNAINLVKSNEGFFVSEVKAEECVNCGLCTKVCPHLNDCINTMPKLSYLGIEKEIIYKDSTSTGFCSELADYFLDNNYYASGAYYNYDKNIVEHFVTNSKSEYEKAQGSKYLQSYTVEAFKEIFSNINEEKIVVFGSPCQIAGIRNYLKIIKKEEQVFLVDFFCHGVPSYLLWENYLKYNKIDSLNKVVFRKKTDKAWNNYCMSLSYDGKTKNSFSKDNDLFHRFFLFDGCLNKTCSKNCKYHSGNSNADVRAGDVWSKKIHKDEKSMSSVLIYNEKVLDYLTKLKNISLKSIDNELIVGGQPSEKRKEAKIYKYVIKCLQKNFNLKIIFYIFIVPKLVINKMMKELKM